MMDPVSSGTMGVCYILRGTGTGNGAATSVPIDRIQGLE